MAPHPFMTVALALAVSASFLAFTPTLPASPTPASPGQQAEPAAAQAKGVTYPLYGVVVSISDRLLVIKGGKGKPDRKFDITSETKFKAGKQPAAIKDVKAGRWVGGLLQKSAKGGNDTVVSLNVEVTQKDTAPAGTQKQSGPVPAPGK